MSLTLFLAFSVKKLCTLVYAGLANPAPATNKETHRFFLGVAKVADEERDSKFLFKCHLYLEASSQSVLRS